MFLPTIAPVIPSSSLSRCSVHPLIPEKAVGRVVLFEPTWSRSRTTKNVTPAMLYSEHVRKERKAYKAYNKKVVTAAALRKKVNLREVQPVKLFSQLTAAERLVFKQRADEEIPYGYYVIGKCTRVETTTSNLSRAPSVERGSSRKRKIVTTAGLNLTRIKPGDTLAILTIFFAKQPSLQAA